MEVSTRNGVTRTTVSNIRKATIEEDMQRLAKLLDPEKHFAGRGTVFTSAKQSLVVDKTLEAAEKVFAVSSSNGKPSKKDSGRQEKLILQLRLILRCHTPLQSTT